jgi:hypothetical protein
LQPRGMQTARVSAFACAIALPIRRPALLLWLVACVSLCLGLLVYLADRHAADVQLLPRFAALGTGPLFGVIAPWLPSFIHPFAFSLLSAAALRRPVASVRASCAICIFWWAVNLACEVGQHPRFSGPIADALLSGQGPNVLTAAMSRYFLRGRFDSGDIAALSAGALAAFAVLWLLHAKGDRHDS